VTVTSDDIVAADDDGVVFVAGARWDEVRTVADQIVADESRQAELIANGTALRIQLDFAGYLARRRYDPDYTLRRHLTERGGAIET
jgi:regulator of RNase E activity RraA